MAANLDNALQQNRIYTQAYHGRCLVGNHCNKYLKTPVFESICNSVVCNTQELTNDRQIVTCAMKISDKFLLLNSLFADIHVRISHQNPMDKSDVNEAGKSIKRYMLYFRQLFPEVHVIPKQHLLEAHCIPWLEQWGIGLSLHGEQGGEETHATINTLKRRVWGLKCPQQRLKVLMTEHLALVSPHFQGVIPLSVNKK